ncbi:MAG TPA: SDR family oxidoreductase [candidate division Zixibacteria bacterium]|nr:SDR family oxidoreductase [candidate division Zixibacteria bacterium]
MLVINKGALMKMAVLADIHSNLAALETTLDHIDRWRPDQILVGGDIINRGPQPRVCFELVLARAEQEGWPLIKGNHEDYVLSYLKGDWPTSGPAYEIQLHARWTFDQMEGLIEPLAALPDEWESEETAGTQIRMVHASMLGNRDGIFPWCTDAELREKMAPAPAVFLVGHTHRPLVRTVDDTLIVNVGSVATRGINRVPYSAAKGGVAATTVCLAMELAEYNIRVNCVAPGGVDAGERAVARNQGLDEYDQVDADGIKGVMDQTFRDTPMGRMGTPDELAAAIAYMASDDAAYVTGEVMHCSGGGAGLR